MSTGKPIVIQVNKPIVIQVEGGVVQAVMNVPEGVVVQIVDFDVEGADENRLSKWVGDEGNEVDCILSEYTYGRDDT